MQAGFEGCLFLCPIKQKIQEIPGISLATQPVRIRTPLLWPRTRICGIHNVVEHSCGFVSPN